jgi:site-specific recombinase
MAEKDDPQKISTIIDGKAADIKRLDNDIMMEVVGVGVAMALDKLRASLDRVETLMDEREFEKASHVGYQEVAEYFVYVQRSLGGLQTAAHQKEALVSAIAQEAHAAYEEVAPYVEKKMQSAVKKSSFPAEKDKTE